MGLIKNAINFGNGFNIGAVAPIDSRMRVESVSDLTSVWTAEIPAYKGMIVTVMETSDVYVLKDVDNYTNIASWVKLGSASSADAGAADALKQAKDYTDKLANGAVNKNTNAIATLNGTVETNGSVAYAVAAEKTRAMAAEKANADAIKAETKAREDAIKLLDAEVTSTDGTHVTVKVTEADGVITAVNVTESNIASTQALATETKAREDADKAINDKIGTVGTGTTIVAMINAEADRATKAESALATRVTANETAITTLNGDANTNGSVAKAVAAEKSRAEGKEGELKTAIDNEKAARTTADTALANRLTVIEGKGEGSIKKAIADIKGTLGATDAKTLADLNDRIDTVVTNAKTYRISQVEGDELTGLGANVKEAYKLVENGDTGNTKVGEYIKVYKDSSLKSVALKGQELQFTYILANGQTSTVSVDVSNFLAESEFANGLQVVNHVVSVKRDSTSEGFLTVGADGVKLSGVQDAIDTEKTRAEAAEKTINDKIGKVETSKTVVGMINDAKGYTDTKISNLYADVTSTGGSRVTVKVKETDGVITAVNVTESDIAKASELDALEAVVGTGFTATDTVAKAIDANKTAINTLNAGSGTTGSVAKAVSDAKASIISGASSDYNTLGKLEQKVKDVAAAAKAAATKIAAKTTGHVTVSSSKDNTTSALTYTISETDIASANELNALKSAVGTGFTTSSTVADHIAVLEGVEVTGENAITVSASGATESKVVSLKLGAQPAEGVAGVVLSQDANGLVAKLQWGTF